jgi:hypothetical protein
MKPDVTLSKLEDAATQLRVRVSYEQLAASVGHGGLCRVKGEYRVIIDKRASTEERITILAGSLARMDLAGLDPALRSLIDLQSPLPTRRAS